MARRKRLNKKVALIGSMVLLVLLVLTVLVVSYLTGDPRKLMEDADVAFAAGDYDGARRDLSRAFDRVKDPNVRVDLLFKLAQVYTRTDLWPKVMGCWERIVQEDPQNIKARYALLETRYLQADSQARVGSMDTGVWKDVETRASELLEVVTRAGVAGQDKAQWDVPDIAESNQPSSPEPIGLYGHFVRGRSIYQQASAGALATPQQGLDRAEADFRKVLDFDPAYVEAYWYLSKAAAERARLLAAEGNIDGQDKALADVDRILAEAVQAAGSKPRSHLCQLESRLDRILKAGPEDSIAAQLIPLEPLYLELMRTFATSADILGAGAKFYLLQAYYQGPGRRSAYLDKAIDAASKAVELDQTRADTVLALAELHYRKAVLFDQGQDAVTAGTIAQRALDLPCVRETSGPRAYANKSNRYGVQVFLAHCAIGQILEAHEGRIEQARAQWLGQAEQAVRQIEQIVGTGGAPEVLKWGGLLALAKGDTDRGVGELVSVYDKGKASNPNQLPDPFVAYVLGRVFMESPEQGQAVRCLADALRGGMGFEQPAAILDYLELLGRLEMWTHVTSPANAYNVDMYERQFGPSARSRALRIRALIGTHRTADAEQELAKLETRDSTTCQLKLDLLQAKVRQVQGSLAALAAGDGRPGISGSTPTSPDLTAQQFRQFRDQEADLVTQLLEIDPNAVSEAMLVSVLQTWIEQGRVTEARQRVDRYLAAQGDRAMALFGRLLLEEPDPKNVPQARRDGLFEQAVLKLTDPMRRATELGVFYRNTGKAPQALEQFLKALDAGAQQGQAAGPTVSGLARAGRSSIRAPYDHPAAVAAGYAFDMAVERQDWATAERILDKVRKANVDGCQGKYFEARLAHGRGGFQEALGKMNTALEQRSVFSHGYLFRATIQDALGNVPAAMEDMERASQMAPTSPEIAKGLAGLLYNRNQRLGAGLTEDQRAEARQAVERAIRLDPSDLTLLAMYAEQVHSTEPLKALQIYQIMLRREPSIQTAVALGTLATSLATSESQATRKAALLDVARAAFGQAYAVDPNNPSVIQGYAEYYRAAGQPDKAEQMQKGTSLLWRNLLRQGRVGQARTILEQALREDPKGIDALRGLVLVSQMTGDVEGLERYSDALITASDTAANRIDQIGMFLYAGLVQQAAARFEQLKAHYPGDAKIVLLGAQVTLRQGQLSKAMALVDQALQSDPASPTAWSLKGQIGLLAGDVDQAIQALTKSKGFHDEGAVRLALAQAYVMAKRPQEAIAEVVPVVEQPATSWQIASTLERLYTSLGRTADLVDLYARLERAFPDDVRWVNRVAAFRFSRGEYSQAEQLYSKARTIEAEAYADQAPAVWGCDSDYAAACDGYLQAAIAAAGDGRDKLRAAIREGAKYAGTPFEPMVLCRMAQAKLKLGDGQGAAEDCRRAIKAQGSDLDAMGTFVRRMAACVGQDEVARQAAQMLETDPASLAAHLVLLHLAALQDKTDQAITEADRCLALAGQDESVQRACAVQKAQLLAVAYDRTSDNRYLQEAITQYESLLVRMPTNNTVLNNLAYLLAQGGASLSRSLEYAKKAFELRPNSPVIMDTYGYVLHKNGRHQEAIELLSAACQQFQIGSGTVPADVYDHLAMAQEALGDKVKARGTYQQALEAGAGQLSPKSESRIKSAIGRLSP